MYFNDWNQYLHELQQHIRYQDEKIRALEERVRILEESHQDKNGTTIEKIEYKFDQLKIETLSGSLHIGLSPEEVQNVEDLALAETQTTGNDSMNQLPPFEQQLTSELQNWLQSTGPAMIRDLAKTHKQQIDENYYSVLLQDIQKQLPNRIHYYKQEATKEDSISNENELRNFILNNIKKEIQYSLTNYMKTHKGE